MGTSRFTDIKGHSEIKVRCGFILRQKEYVKFFSQTKSLTLRHVVQMYIPVV